MKEAKGDGLPGFQKKWTSSVSSRKLTEEDILSYEDFRHVVYKWHVNLLKVGGNQTSLMTFYFIISLIVIRCTFFLNCLLIKAFSACLESKEYMQIRNALLMLTKIIDFFPIVKKLSISMEDVVSKLKEEEREDLKVLASRYHAMLSIKRSLWIPEESFHLVKAVSKQTPLSQNSPFLGTDLTKTKTSSTVNPSSASSIIEGGPQQTISTPLHRARVTTNNDSLKPETENSSLPSAIDNRKRLNQVPVHEGKFRF